MSTESLDFLKRKQDQRNALRQEYWKLVTKPRSPGGYGDAIFDAGIMRHQSLGVTRFEYFKPNFYNGALYVGLFIVPLVGYCMLLKYDRDRKEHLYRTGQVAYEDRRFKFV